MKNILKKIIRNGTLVAFIALAGGVQAQSKIATIDLRKVFDNYYKTKQADTVLKEEAADYKKNRQTFIDSYKKSEEAYKALIDKANDQAVSAEERAKNKKAAEQKIAELKEAEQTITEYDRASQAKITEKQRLKRDAIVAEIRGVVEQKAKAASYTLVIDTAGESINSTPIVLYTNGENDLTEPVLTQLNSTASPVTTGTEEKKTDEKKP